MRALAGFRRTSSTGDGGGSSTDIAATGDVTFDGGEGGCGWTSLMDGGGGEDDGGGVDRVACSGRARGGSSVLIISTSSGGGGVEAKSMGGVSVEEGSICSMSAVVDVVVAVVMGSDVMGASIVMWANHVWNCVCRVRRRAWHRLRSVAVFLM
ncbi:hypothetical protein H257_10725 [Aphanomyces astaci]|uniref:Uncharacterized protein n=1 Tax=Aphanomyces astaci TaxID=112090 RepID=W4G6C6_APHAT|nr:hypothetical protein H257_10725 [Aphanomyces astaci]ETV74579.1 hypothetical protein H257_10725 [Aphanomyces astaci]|eukprot:XP_009835666.1 hypothetical protein H257_10725 [Aphanomyces astaci]